MLAKVDKYGRGSAVANGEGFVDLAPGDTFSALEAQLKRRVADRFDNAALGISATIGSKRNASELAKHLASGEEEEVHKFAAKNIGVLFARGQFGISHDDKKAVAGQRWITRFVRVFTPFRFAGAGYLATLTLKDIDPDKRIYAVEAVEINQDAKSRSTPRGAISEDLNSAPFQDLTSQLVSMVSYYVGDVNRTHPKFIGRDEIFSSDRAAELLAGFVQGFCSKQQVPSTKHPAPEFSIIIPVYNVAPYLRECLDSVLAQTFTDWEAICVDDGSTDGSGAILDEYAVKDKRIRVIHQKNAGEGGARNAALDVARGKWGMFLDADDVMAPNALNRLAALIEKYPNEKLFRFGFANFEDGAALPKVEHFGADDGPVDIAHEIAYDDFYVYVWQFLYRRSLIEGMKFDHYKRGADRTFIVPVLCRANSFVATEDVCNFYRKRAGSAMNSRPSVQVLKDELSHRVDVVEMIDKSGKKMSYRGTGWLESYCTKAYFGYVFEPGAYSVAEQKDLMAWFYHELPRMQSAKDYSEEARKRLAMLSCFRGRLACRMVVRDIPLAICRAKIILTDPMRVVRALARRMAEREGGV